MKSLIISTLLFLLAVPMFAQQRPPFSEKTVEVKDRVFLPYTKGEVVRKINGPFKPVFDKICSIITAWDSITPPQGIKVGCYSFDHSLDIYFLAYLFEEGTRFSSEGGPNLSIYVNDPLQMFGSPVAPGIYLCPQKKADFFGYPIYLKSHIEVTIVNKKNIPLFIPVTQEEYLKAIIAKEEQNESEISGSDYQATLQEMEQAYQKLLKTDQKAAKEFKQQMDEFKTEINQYKDGNQLLDLVSELKNELAGLTAAEKTRQAYYGGSWAMDKYHNASGLVPYENRENGDALVRPNPALIEKGSDNQVQLLVISWSLSNETDNDKPRFYREGSKGFRLADHFMSELYHNQTIWSDIFRICN